MKICGENMKVTLTVHGRKRTFSEQELKAILEKHFSIEATENVTTSKVLTEGQWFEVNPLGIDQTLFKTKKKDVRQEGTRELILEAFAELKRNPEKYGKKFKTMMPYKTWLSKTVGELKELASNLGNHNADWVEQALEWAQRITNGESWEAICNEADTADWYRLVVWKNGYSRFVGGSRHRITNKPASAVGLCDCGSGVITYYDIVPLVVLYEK